MPRAKKAPAESKQLSTTGIVDISSAGLHVRVLFSLSDGSTIAANMHPDHAIHLAAQFTAAALSCTEKAGTDE